MSRLRPLIALFLTLLVVAADAPAATAASATFAHASSVRQAGDAIEPEVAVVVTDVTDGDTLTVQRADGTTETLRLLGIDAPEQASGGHDR